MQKKPGDRIRRYFFSPACQLSTTVNGVRELLAMGTANRNCFPSGETSQSVYPAGVSNKAVGDPGLPAFISTEVILPSPETYNNSLPLRCHRGREPPLSETMIAPPARET